MPWSSTWSIRTSTIGRSPEIPCLQRAEGPLRLRSMSLDGERATSGRSTGTRVARRWKRCASSLVTPRCRNWTCAWVQDRLATRSNVAGSRYLSASASTRSRESATIRARWTRTVAPGATRTRRRMLKIGSRTVPTVFESGRRSSMATGIADATGPGPESGRDPSRTAARRTFSPCATITCAAQIGSSRSRGRRPAEQRLGRGSELGLDEEVRERGMRRIGCRAAPGRSPRTT